MADLDIGTLKGSIELQDNFTQALRGLMGNLDGLDGSFRRVGFGIVEMGRAMESTGAIMTASITAPLLAAAGASIKFAGDFQTAMTKLTTLGGESAAAIGQLHDQVLSLSTVVGKSPEELAGGLLSIEKAGFRSSEAMNILGLSSRMAAVGMGTVEETSKELIGAMLTYQKEGYSAAKIADMFSAATKLSQVDIGSLTQQLGRVAPVAAGFNVEMKDVLASIASFTHLGASAPVAATGLMAVLKAIENPTRSTVDGFKLLGSSVEAFRKEMSEKGLTQSMIDLVQAAQQMPNGMQVLSRVFPTLRGLADVLATAGAQANFFKSSADKILDSAGTLSTAFDLRKQNFAFQWDQFKATLERLAITFGETLLPQVNKLLGVLQSSVLPVIQKLIDLWSKLPEPIQQFALVTGLAVAAIGPFLFAGGNVVLMLGHWTRAFGNMIGSEGIGAWVASLLGAKSAAAIFEETVTGATATTVASAAAFTQVPASAAAAGAAFADVGASATVMSSQVTKASSSLLIFEPTVKAITILWTGFTGMLRAQFTAVTGAMSQFVSAVAPSFSNLRTAFANLGPAVVDSFKILASGLSSTFKTIGGIFQELGGIIIAPFQEVWMRLSVVIENAATTWAPSIGSAFRSIGGIFKELGGILILPFQEIWKRLSVVIENATLEWAPSISSAFKSIGGIIKELGGIIAIPFQQIWVGLTVAAENTLNTLAPAVEGVATTVTASLSGMGAVVIAPIVAAWESLQVAVIATTASFVRLPIIEGAVTAATALWATTTTIATQAVVATTAAVQGITASTAIMTTAWEAATIAVSGFIGALSILSTVALVAAAAIAAFELVKYINDAKTAEERTTAWTGAIAGAAAGFAMWGPLGAVIGGAVGGVTAKIVEQMGFLKPWSDGLAVVLNQLRGIPEEITRGTIAALDARANIDAFKESIDKQTKSARDSAQGWLELGKEWSNSGNLTHDAFERVVQGLKSAVAAGQPMTDEIQRWISGFEQLDKAARAAATAVVSVPESMKGMTADQRRQQFLQESKQESAATLTPKNRAFALQELHDLGKSPDAVKRIADEIRIVGDEIGNTHIDEAVQRLKDSLSGAKTATNEFSQAWAKLAGAGETFESVLNSVDGKVVESIKYYLQHGETVEKVAAAFKGMGGIINEGQVQAIKHQLDLADAEVKSKKESLDRIAALDADYYSRTAKDEGDNLNSKLAVESAWYDKNLEILDNAKLGWEDYYKELDALNTDYFQRLVDVSLAATEKVIEASRAETAAAAKAIGEQLDATRNLPGGGEGLNSPNATGPGVVPGFGFGGDPEALKSWEKGLGDISAAFSHLATISGGTLDGITRGIGRLISAMDAAMKAEGAMGKIFGGLFSEGSFFGVPVSTIGKKAFAIAQVGVGMLADLTNNARTAGGVMINEMAKGAQLGAIAGPWGMVAGAIIGGIIGAIKGQPEWSKIADDIGRDMGVHISDATAKSIEASEGVVEDALIQSLTDAGSAAVAAGEHVITPIFGKPTVVDKSGKKVDTRPAAEELNLSKVISDAGGLNDKNLDTFTGKLRNVFVALQVGQITTGLATKVLDENFRTFVAASTSGVGVLNAKMAELIRLDKQFGTDSKEIGKYIKEQATAGTDAFTKALQPAGDAYSKQAEDQQKVAELTGQLNGDQLKDLAKIADLKKKIAGADAVHAASYRQQIQDILNKEDSRLKQINDLNDDYDKQGRIIAATTIHTQNAATAMGSALAGEFDGLIQNGTSFEDAIKAITPSIQSLNLQLIHTGFSGGEAFDTLNKLVNIYSDDVAGPALSSVNSLAKGIASLANMGKMDQTTFSGLGEQISGTFNELIKQGYDGSTALMAMQDPLQTMWELEQEFGYKADDATQALIDEAAAAGEVGEKHKSSTQQMIDGIAKVGQDLDALLTKLGVALPAAAGVGAKAVGGLPNQLGNAADIAGGKFEGLKQKIDAMPEGPEKALALKDLENAMAEAAANGAVPLTGALGDVNGGLEKMPRVIETWAGPLKMGFDNGTSSAGNMNDAVAILSGSLGTKLPASFDPAKSAINDLGIQFTQRMPADAGTAVNAVNDAFSRIQAPHVTIQIDWSIPPMPALPTPTPTPVPSKDNAAVMGATVMATGLVKHFETGGTVLPMMSQSVGMHIPFVPSGTDTVPAMLTPGEEVLSTSEAQQYHRGSQGATRPSQPTIHIGQYIETVQAIDAASFNQKMNSYMRKPGGGTDVAIGEMEKDKRNRGHRIMRVIESHKH